MSNEPEATPSLIGSTTVETTDPPANPEAAPDPATPVEPLIGGDPAPVDPATPADPPVVVEPLTLESLTLPEGFTLQDEAGAPLPEATEFLEFFNSKSLTKEDAEKMLGIHTTLLNKAAGEYAAQWEATQADWQEQVRALPEFGGAALPATLSNIAKVLDKYGDKEARDAFRVTGAGNHPALVRMMAKIAKDLNEAPPVSGTPPGTVRSREERMYGNTK